MEYWSHPPRCIPSLLLSPSGCSFRNQRCEPQKPSPHHEWPQCNSLSLPSKDLDCLAGSAYSVLVSGHNLPRYLMDIFSLLARTHGHQSWLGFDCDPEMVIPRNKRLTTTIVLDSIKSAEIYLLSGQYETHWLNLRTSVIVISTGSRLATR